jgi:hypothetical protein
MVDEGGNFVDVVEVAGISFPGHVETAIDGGYTEKAVATP